jgi:hypothetical protein
VLHQVGVLFDLYYDARKHKSETTSATVRYKYVIHFKVYQFQSLLVTYLYSYISGVSGSILQKFLLVKVTVPQLVKKFPEFYGTKGLITVFTAHHHQPD